MKLRKYTIAGLLAVVLLGAGGFLIAAPGFPAGTIAAPLTMVNQPADIYVPDEILVRFKPGVSSLSRAQSITSTGALQIAPVSQPGWAHLKVPAGLTVPQALAVYATDPAVDVAQPNYIYHASVVPNDANYGAQWALKNTAQIVATTPQPGYGALYATDNPGVSGDDIDIQPAWDHITNCSAVTVAVVDTGVNYNQSDLSPNMWNGGVTYPNHGWDYVKNNNDPMDLNGHGTHVAGIIGAVGNNGLGTAGVCWTASIMAVRVLDAAGSGTTAGVIQGINFAVSNGARVINMSLGGPSFDTALSNAITTAQSGGVLVVVAAGNGAANNDSGTTPTYPCNFPQPNLICVAALDQGYQLATFSNYGATSVDVGAPGANILNTWAGANAVVTDPMTSGWNFSTTTSGGWAYQSLSTTAGPQPFLVNPSPYLSALYNNATDDRAYKQFSLTGNVAVLEFTGAVAVAANDHFRVAYASGGNDPFAGGTGAYDLGGISTLPYMRLFPVDISGCISAKCSVGFQLQSDASGQSYGVALTQLTIQTLALNAASYNTISGTSMAAPHVTGVAAMVMAFNPLYTYADAINAISNGGRRVAALAGKTASGRAVDALGALAYINPPAGLQANVQ